MAVAEEHPAIPATSRVSISLPALLIAAMAAPVLSMTAIGVLAPHLLSGFDIGRGQLGLVVAVGTMGGGLASPAAGRVVDRIGARRTLVVVFGLTALAFFVFVAADRYWMLLLAGLAVAVALAGANPATNDVVLRRLPAGRRATVTGLKQSGAALASLLGGALVPSAARFVGWRPTLAALGIVTSAGVGAALRLLPHDVAAIGTDSRGDSAPCAAVALGVCALLTGIANSAVLFVPLYAVESLGVSPSLGGLVLGIGGVATITGRVAWARVAGASGRPLAALQILSLGGTVGFALVLAASHGGGWWALAAGALVIGTTTSSWISLAMLAVIEESSRASGVGAASGTVMLGFYLGLGIGPPTHGFLVDHIGSYDVMWSVSIVSAALAAAAVHVWVVPRTGGYLRGRPR